MRRNVMLPVLMGGARRTIFPAIASWATGNAGSGTFSQTSGYPQITMPTGTGWAGFAGVPVQADWSKKSFRLRIKCDDWAHIVDGYCIVTTGTGKSYIWQWLPDADQTNLINNEWLELAFTKSDFAVNAGSPNWAQVSAVTWQIYSSDGFTPTVSLDQFVYADLPAAGTVSICFDDGYSTNLTEAMYRLWKNNIQSTHFVIDSAQGTAGYLAAADITELHTNGHEIGGHGEAILTGMTLANATTDVTNQATYNDTWSRGRRLYAYPNGGYNDAIQAMVLTKGFSRTRGTRKARQSVNLQSTILQTRQLGTPVTLAAAEGWIDAAVANKDWLILTFHRLISPTVAETDWTPADFDALVAYAAASGAQLKSIGEVLGYYGHAVPAIPNYVAGSYVNSAQSGILFTNTRTVGAIANTQAGDIAICYCMSQYVASPPDASWTLLAAPQNGFIYCYVFAKQLDGPLGATTWTWSGSHNQTAEIVVYRNVQIPTARQVVSAGNTNATTLGLYVPDEFDNTFWSLYGYTSAGDGTHGWVDCTERLAVGTTSHSCNVADKLFTDGNGVTLTYTCSGSAGTRTSLAVGVALKPSATA